VPTLLLLGDCSEEDIELVKSTKLTDDATTPDLVMISDERVMFFINDFRILRIALGIVPMGDLTHAKGTFWGMLKWVFHQMTGTESYESVDGLVFSQKTHGLLTAVDFPEAMVREPGNHQDPTGDDLVFAVMHIYGFPQDVHVLVDHELAAIPVSVDM
jgi:hypothetical protein